MKFVHAFALLACLFSHYILCAVGSSDDSDDSVVVRIRTTTTTTTTSTTASATTTTASALVVDAEDDDDSSESVTVDEDDDEDETTSTTTTTTTATPSTTTTTEDTEDPADPLVVVNNTELCECYDIDLVCAPIEMGDQVCYYYTLTSTGNDSFCNGLESIFLSIDGGGECNASLADVTASLTDAAPSCLDIGTSTSPFDAIQITLDETLASGLVAVTTTSVAADTNADTYYDSVDSGDSVDSSDSSDTDAGSDTDNDTANDALPGPGRSGDVYVPGNIRIFTLCFDSDAVSGGVQENGQIGFDNDDLPFVCSYPNILPDFCDGASDPSDPSVSSTPTTAATTTTAAPTTVATPTTESPTTTAPTTASPTTAAPTTATPTTATPTTAAPITAAPTTASPTTAAPTTATPTTATPTTAAPTTAVPTTAAPTSAPTFSVCNSTDALNVAFLLDESGSVDAAEWQATIDFVDRVAEFDLSPTSYISLFEFASLPSYTQFLDWTPVDIGGDRSHVTTALDANNYNTNGVTRTWDAINRLLDESWDYRSTCTDGCDFRHDLVFVLTDGNPTGDIVCPDMIPRINATQDIDIVVVIIDPDGTVDTSQVACLDYNDNEVDVILITEFDSAAFHAIEADIRAKTCSGTLPPLGASSRPENGTQWRYEDGSIGLGPVPTADGSGTAPTDPAPLRIADGESANNDLESGGAGQVSTLGIVLIVLGIVVLASITGFVAWSKWKNGGVYHKTSTSIDMGNMQQDDAQEGGGEDADGETAGIVVYDE